MSPDWGDLNICGHLVSKKERGNSNLQSSSKILLKTLWKFWRCKSMKLCCLRYSYKPPDINNTDTCQRCMLHYLRFAMTNNGDDFQAVVQIYVILPIWCRRQSSSVLSPCHVRGSLKMVVFVIVKSSKIISSKVAQFSMIFLNMVVRRCIGQNKRKERQTSTILLKLPLERIPKPCPEPKW